MKFSALFCAVAALALVGCSPHPAAAPGAVSDGAGQAPAQRYTYEEHGVFGYTQALSESDRTRGVVSLPMVLVRYDGRRGDMYGFKTQEEDGRWTVMSCREPCGAMKLETYGATHIDTRIMPIEPGSILEAIVQDARNGFLDHGMPGAQQKG